ncbi:hypothetical protein ACFX2J_007416 [Malus domestica]
MLSNIYATTGDWANVACLKLQMRSTRVQKPPGASSVEVANEVYEITIFDKLHSNSNEVYGMIDRVLLHFKQMNVSSWSISNGIGGQIAKDNIYLVSIS